MPFAVGGSTAGAAGILYDHGKFISQLVQNSRILQEESSSPFLPIKTSPLNAPEGLGLSYHILGI